MPIGACQFCPPPVDDGPLKSRRSTTDFPIRNVCWRSALAMAVGMAVLDGTIVNVALPTIAPKPRDPACELDLDRQRLPARRHHIAAAAVGARRHDRLPARLHAGPRPFHRSLARLRLRAVPSRVGDRARGAGSRRGRRHERQYRARPVHLPSSRLGQGVGNIAVVVAVVFRGGARPWRLRSSRSHHGGGCFWSTSQSGSSRSWWRCARCPTRRARSACSIPSASSSTR